MVVNEQGRIEMIDESIDEIHIDGFGLVKRYDALYKPVDGILYSYAVVSVYPDALEVYKENYDEPNGKGQQYLKTDADTLKQYHTNIDIAKIEQFSQLTKLYNFRLNELEDQINSVQKDKENDLFNIGIDRLRTEYPEYFI